jgi:hypothetical protein
VIDSAGPPIPSLDNRASSWPTENSVIVTSARRQRSRWRVERLEHLAGDEGVGGSDLPSSTDFALY